MQQRGGEQQVRVESRVDEADLVRERGYADAVLEQAAQVGVVSGARAYVKSGQHPRVGPHCRARRGAA